MKGKLTSFPRLDSRRMDIAIRWALRWLSRRSNSNRPDDQTIELFYARLVSAFLACESHLHRHWVRHNTAKELKWRQDIRSFRRNPKRLRDFAAKEHLAQILLYGAARAGATENLEKLLVQMDEDPVFFEQIISLALDEDTEQRSERLLHDQGGRPRHNYCYFPIVEAAAKIIEAVTGRPFGRSTTSEAGTDTRDAGKATGPSVEFLTRLLAAFPEPFTNERIAHLIRDALAAR